eukprot:6197078-Pleurochrysis_carterae.AAC.3
MMYGDRTRDRNRSSRYDEKAIAAVTPVARASSASQGWRHAAGHRPLHSAAADDAAWRISVTAAHQGVLVW